jgi:hypothetical protein
MEYDTFNELAYLWNKNKEYSFEEFYNEYTNFASTEWGKVNREGEYYNGFYKNLEINDPFSLTFTDNGKGLFELPYPKEVILRTIKYSDSVRHTNYICEWIKKKMEQIGYKMVKKAIR